MVAGFGAQTLFSLVATYSLARHTLRPRLRGDLKLMLFGMKSLANEITSWSMDNLDRFLVGKLWGVFSLGLYSVAFNLSKAPSGLLISTAQSIAFASAARLHGNPVAVRKGFLVVMAAIALATLPVFVLVAFESETVLYIVYGAKWIKAAPYMTALALSIPLLSMGSITAAILRGTGAAGTELVIMVTSAIVLLGSYLILRDESLVVAVWAVPLAYLVRFLLLVAAIHKRLELRLADLLTAFRGPFVLALTGILVTVLTHDIPQAEVIGMGILPPLAGCLAILVLLASRFNWCLGAPLSDMLREKLSAGRLGSTIAWLERGKH
ncbi:oligosaccharide flippase family protein [Dechloromonas sp. HYN0024]|uniref:oligosaccharide flippase family protein n=1 Tax=Dechloromonas sp. HYN0024 TaxID=2231055 RepID=UPI00210F8920|nr:oligosaccharide flippase family protein [Dechloromonas sp. HYN0024]